MDTPGKRLQQARRRAGFKSSRSAAIAHEWAESTYYAHENDTREFDEDQAKSYGRAFQAPWLWLLHGDAAPRNNNQVAIAGRIAAGGSIGTAAEQVGEELATIEVSFPIPQDARAYEVTGDSMFPRYDDGDVIIVLNRPRPLAELLNFEAVVITVDGDRYLKRIVEGSRRGIYDLESFNAPKMKNVKIAEAVEVHAVVRKGQWRKLSGPGQKRVIKQRLKR
jgi:phage repressor protein C with HTH and peptisase S24 domain